MIAVGFFLFVGKSMQAQLSFKMWQLKLSLSKVLKFDSNAQMYIHWLTDALCSAILCCEVNCEDPSQSGSSNLSTHNHTSCILTDVVSGVLQTNSSN